MSIKITIEMDLASLDDSQLSRTARELIVLAERIQSLQQAATSSAQRRRRRPPQPRSLEGTDSERWAAFLQKMSSQSKAFARLIEDAHPHVLTRKRAFKALNLSSGQALGGLTGAFGRWSAIDKVKLPWMRIADPENPGWLWIGFNQDGSLRSPKNSKVISDPVSHFWDTLPDRSKQFIEAIQKRGEVSVSELMKTLEIEDARTLGGIAGTLKRWSRKAGVDLPYESHVIEGKKGFRWTSKIR